MAAAVYVLCTLTSIACAALLIRGYRRSRVRLLLWSALCFLGLAFNNTLLMIDFFSTIDIIVLRKIPAVLGVLLLLYGLTSESR